MTFSTSGYTYDFEIKISRSDYLADFKKPRHKIFAAAIKGDKYTVVQGCEGWSGRYNQERRRYTNIRIEEVDKLIGNRFYFVVPYGLIGKDEIPDYAGLIYIQDQTLDKCLKIKEAPLLHKYKHDPKKRFQTLYNLYESSMIKKLF